MQRPETADQLLERAKGTLKRVAKCRCHVAPPRNSVCQSPDIRSGVCCGCHHDGVCHTPERDNPMVQEELFS